MYLARHGQTMFNVIYGETRKDPGIVDPPLTDEGKRQAEALAADLKTKGVARIICSPYTRALETAAICADALNLSCAVEADVRERTAFFCDIGTATPDLSAQWPHLDFAHLPELWWNQTEETVPDFHSRCAGFRRAASAMDGWAETVVITHWGVIRSLTGERVGNAVAVRFDPNDAHPPLDETWP